MSDREEVAIVENKLTSRVRSIIEPIVAGLDLELYDLEFRGGTLAVTVERVAVHNSDPHHNETDDQPRQGVDLGDLTAATRAISRALDESDPIESHYTLEVSSPGLERPLRTPAHYVLAVGSAVAIKTLPTYDGPRRLAGTLVAADPDAATIAITLDDGAELSLDLGDIEKARTVFQWGPAPRPGKPRAAKNDKTRKVNAS